MPVNRINFFTAKQNLGDVPFVSTVDKIEYGVRVMNFCPAKTKKKTKNGSYSTA